MLNNKNHMKNFFDEFCKTCRLKYFYIITLLIVSISTNAYSLQSTVLPDSLSKKLKSKNIEEQIKGYAVVMEYYNKVMPEKALEYGQNALTIAKSKNYRKGESDILFHLGVAYNAQNQFQKALECFQQSIKIKYELKEMAGIGRCYNSIGLVYNSLGEFEKALDYCLKAIKILETENDKKSLCESYNHLGIIYYILGDYQKGIEYSNKSVALCEKINAPLTLAFSHENLVIIYIKTKDYEKALYHVKKTIEIRRNQNDKAGLAGSYENNAIILRHTKKYEEALKYYNMSIQMKKELNKLNDLAPSYAGMGITYLEMKQYNKSLDYTFKALELRKANGEKRAIQSSLNKLSEIYTAMEEYKKALEYYKLSKAYSDSLMNEQKNKAILVLQGEFQLEKREREIEFLQRENTLQKYLWIILLITTLLISFIAIFIYKAYHSKQKLNTVLTNHNQEITRQKEELQNLNEKLKELIATKDKFFSIIAHDLKSPFQGFLGLTEIIATETENMPVKELAKLGKVINRDAVNLFSLLKNLLDWAQMQKGSLECNKETLLINSIITTSIDSMKSRAEQKGITIINSAEETLPVIADAKMLSSILTNLLSNAIKFTDRNGIVTINTSKNGDGVVKVSISDTGKGISDPIKDKLFKVGERIGTKGTEGELSTGLGLLLCKEFIEKLGGKIWAESELNKGSKFFFTLPAA